MVRGITRSCFDNGLLEDAICFRTPIHAEKATREKFNQIGNNVNCQTVIPSGAGLTGDSSLRWPTALYVNRVTSSNFEITCSLS